LVEYRSPKPGVAGSSPVSPAITISTMSSVIQKIIYRFVSWHFSPKSLIKRATYYDNPRYFYHQISRLREATLFLLKIGIRPLTLRCLALAYKDSGYMAIGFGYYANALRKGDQVIKLYEFTTKCNDEERQALVASINKRIEIADNYLGRFLTGTEAKVAPHPITHMPCVSIYQNYVDGSLLTMHPYADFITKEQRTSLLNMLTKAKELYNKTGYLVDVNSHNLMVVNNDVFIIDTILMGKVDVIMLPRTLKILNNELEHTNMLVHEQ
jgi:hypothetical protein